MAYPGVARIELPILHELVATGGVEDVRFLYNRLVAYFPQLDEGETHAAISNGHRSQWRRLIQRAGRVLSDKRQIERERGHWTITATGRRRAKEEGLAFSLTDAATDTQPASLSHTDVQQMLLDIGRVLGYHAQSEFEYYDVVWRAGGETSPRLSHVFEVQHKGNIDAALAKLKRAYEAQRSKPFLIITSERDTNRAQKSMSLARTGPFHEIGSVTTILSFEQLRRLHRALTSVEDLLADIFER